MRCATAAIRAWVTGGFCDEDRVLGDAKMHLDIANQIIGLRYETGGLEKGSCE
jgi:hypothetical protein